MNDPFPSAFRFIVADELRSAIAGPNRTFDGRGQAGIRPIAGERQIAPGRVRAGASFILRGSRGKSGAALAHDLPRRQFALHAAGFADIPPDRLRQFLARQVHQPVGIADRD